MYPSGYRQKLQRTMTLELILSSSRLTFFVGLECQRLWSVTKGAISVKKLLLPYFRNMELIIEFVHLTIHKQIDKQKFSTKKWRNCYKNWSSQTERIGVNIWMKHCGLKEQHIEHH